MKATYNPDHQTKFTTSFRRENHGLSWSVNCFDASDITLNCDGTILAPVTVRIYNSRAASYCCVWINHHKLHTSGNARATGYGYHRPSAAMQLALVNAGITLDQDIDGRGEGEMKKAVLAIGKMLGFLKPVLVESHP